MRTFIVSVFWIFFARYHRIDGGIGARIDSSALRRPINIFFLLVYQVGWVVNAIRLGHGPALVSD